MTIRYGYWVDLSKRLFDPGATSWIHALPVGKFEHPVYGSMEFTPEKINNYALSVKTRARGIVPDIDYDHKEQDGKAAGWVKDAEARDDGLYLLVDWTPRAAEAIKNGEYRYFSPEFDDEWVDPQGQKHSDVLFGGALTNRPFLKNLLPVNLSEITTTQPTGGTLDPKTLREALKLPETATDEEVLAAIQNTQISPPAPPAPPTPAPVPVGAAQLDEVAITKLLSEHPMLKELKAGLEAAQRQLAESERARVLEATRHKLSSLSAQDNGRQYVLPPSVIDAIAEGTVAGDPVKMSEAFINGLEQLTKVGFVELGERGKMHDGREKSQTQMLGEQVLALRTNHFKTTGKALSYADAVRAVVRQNPELYAGYRQESYAGKEE